MLLGKFIFNFVWFEFIVYFGYKIIQKKR